MDFRLPVEARMYAQPEVQLSAVNPRPIYTEYETIPESHWQTSVFSSNLRPRAYFAMAFKNKFTTFQNLKCFHWQYSIYFYA